MTATVAEIPHELMVHITERITHEVPGINRVLYDFTPKPTEQWNSNNIRSIYITRKRSII